MSCLSQKACFEGSAGGELAVFQPLTVFFFFFFPGEKKKRRGKKKKEKKKGGGKKGGGKAEFPPPPPPPSPSQVKDLFFRLKVPWVEVVGCLYLSTYVPRLGR